MQVIIISNGLYTEELSINFNNLNLCHHNMTKIMIPTADWEQVYLQKTIISLPSWTRPPKHFKILNIPSGEMFDSKLFSRYLEFFMKTP